MRIKQLGIIIAALGLATLAACVGDDVGSDVSESNQIPYAEGSAEARAILQVANDQTLGVEQFDSSEHVGLNARAAENIVAYRDGDPATADDDNFFDSLKELFSVSYCKKSCLNKLLAYAKLTGIYSENGNISVLFSPQASENSHLARIAEIIDNEADEASFTLA